jgi:hypothetical protein
MSSFHYLYSFCKEETCCYWLFLCQSSWFILLYYKCSTHLWTFPIVSHNNRPLYTTFTIIFSTPSSIVNSVWMSWWHHTLESLVYSCPCANESVHRVTSAIVNKFRWSLRNFPNDADGSHPNSLDQFCVNFANEHLQNFVQRHIFEAHMDEYQNVLIYVNMMQLKVGLKIPMPN